MRLWNYLRNRRLTLLIALSLGLASAVLLIWLSNGTEIVQDCFAGLYTAVAMFLLARNELVSSQKDRRGE